MRRLVYALLIARRFDRRRKARLLTLLAGACLLASLLSGAASARMIGLYINEFMGGFVYPAQLGYVYDRDFGLGLGLRGPEDLFLDHEGYLWIVDTGNHRVVKIDRFGELQMVIGGPGSPVQFRQPQGVFVNRAGEVYVADTENGRIVVFNSEGEHLRTFERPRSSVLGDDFHYQPSKLIQDHRGWLYVVNGTDYRGLMMIDNFGDFRGFFAPNRLKWTLRRFLINLFATEAQRQRLARDLPAPHSNLVIDEFGFIYTSTLYQENNQIKKLNAVETDVYNPDDNPKVFGIEASAFRPSFIDLAVDDKGIISALDSAQGFVYQYDQDRNLLLIFGRKGEQKGAFGFPVSIVVDNDGLIYVLDKDRNNIQVFRPTQFAELVHAGAQLYNDGRYQEAAIPWQEVLQYNTNYALAHSGIGKAYMRLEAWPQAARHYRTAFDRDGYSEAFMEMRYEFLRANFGWAVLGLAIVGVLIWLAFRAAGWILRQPYDESGTVVQTLQNLLRCMIDPHEAFWDLKHGGRGNVLIALFLVLMVFAVRVINIQYMSFQIHDIDPRFHSLLMEISRIFGGMTLWALASYAVGAIFEGEGRFRELFTAAAYSTGPYLFFSWPLTLFSHVLLRGEKPLILIPQIVIMCWVFWNIFLSARVTHNFSFSKTLGTTAITLFGIGVILGVGGLAWALTDQMVGFVREIVVELTIRA